MQALQQSCSGLHIRSTLTALGLVHLIIKGTYSIGTGSDNLNVLE